MSDSRDLDLILEAYELNEEDYKNIIGSEDSVAINTGLLDNISQKAVENNLSLNFSVIRRSTISDRAMNNAIHIASEFVDNNISGIKDTINNILHIDISIDEITKKIKSANRTSLINVTFNLKDALFEISSLLGVNGINLKSGFIIAKVINGVLKLSKSEISIQDAQVLQAIYILVSQREKPTVDKVMKFFPASEQGNISTSLDNLHNIKCIVLGTQQIKLIESITIKSCKY
ncbi:MAG: hypothetical protein AAFQ80_17535 [Cyanobacteria bacterium J06621_8]